MTVSRTTSERLADFISNMDLLKLPQQVSKMAKFCLLDYVGVTLASHREPGSKKILEYVSVNQSKGKSTIIGTKIKTSVENACLANGMLGHLLDFDDSIHSYMAHPSVVLYPLILALGEEYGISGQKVLGAYALGTEVGRKIASLCMPVHYRVGWHSTSTIGTFTATAAASKLLKLKRDEMMNALGIAGSLASGVRENFGTLTKPLHAGLAARNGLFAALVASKGINASPRIFGAENGFLKLYGANAEAAIIQKGRKTFELSQGIYFKLYPSCTETHPAIEATLNIIKRTNLDPHGIKKINCFTTQQVIDQVSPRLPDTGPAGRFSIPFCVANALVYRDVNLSHFRDQNVKSAKIRELMNKCEVRVSPEFKTRKYGESSATMLEIIQNDGEVVREHIEFAKGDSRNPLSEDQLISKFKKCAARSLSIRKVEQLVETILILEKLKNITPLMEYVTAR